MLQVVPLFFTIVFALYTLYLKLLFAVVIALYQMPIGAKMVVLGLVLLYYALVGLKWLVEKALCMLFQAVYCAIRKVASIIFHAVGVFAVGCYRRAANSVRRGVLHNAAKRFHEWMTVWLVTKVTTIPSCVSSLHHTVGRRMICNAKNQLLPQVGRVCAVVLKDMASFVALMFVLPMVTIVFVWRSTRDGGRCVFRHSKKMSVIGFACAVEFAGIAREWCKNTAFPFLKLLAALAFATIVFGWHRFEGFALAAWQIWQYAVKPFLGNVLRTASRGCGVMIKRFVMWVLIIDDGAGSVREPPPVVINYQRRPRAAPSSAPPSAPRATPRAAAPAPTPSSSPATPRAASPNPTPLFKVSEKVFYHERGGNNNPGKIIKTTVDDGLIEYTVALTGTNRVVQTFDDRLSPLKLQLPKYKKGEIVRYCHKKRGHFLAVVLQGNIDGDGGEPYYTISIGGTEKNTNESFLSPVPRNGNN